MSEGPQRSPDELLDEMERAWHENQAQRRKEMEQFMAAKAAEAPPWWVGLGKVVWWAWMIVVVVFLGAFGLGAFIQTVGGPPALGIIGYWVTLGVWTHHFWMEARERALKEAKDALEK